MPRAAPRRGTEDCKLKTPLLIAIMGPTASGKSDVAESLAVRSLPRQRNGDNFAKPTRRGRLGGGCRR